MIPNSGGVSNREIDFGFGRGAVRVCVRACVRACEAVSGREDDESSGAGPKNWKFVGVCPAVPGRARPCPARPGPARPGRRPPPALSKVKNKTLVLSGSDRIRTRSYSRGVFPMGFRPQKSSKFRVFFRSLSALTPRRRWLRWCLGCLRKNAPLPHGSCIFENWTHACRQNRVADSQSARVVPV